MNYNNDTDEIIVWISKKVAELTGAEPASIGADRNILEYGLDSLRSVHLVGEIELLIGKEIPVTTILDHPTIFSLANFIREQGAIV
jgi:acyl carrier protein